MADGSLVFDTKLDASGLKKGLQGVGGVAKGAVTAMTKAIALTATAVAAGAALTIKAGKEYETSMAKARTMFGDVNVDLDNLDAKMLAMSSTTGTAATELGQALYSALSAGIPVTEDMAGATAFLEESAKLAVAGFTDVDTAVASTAKVLNAYGLDVSETARIQGILMATQNNGITTVGELSQTLAQVTPVAAAMGVEFEYVGAALATMTAKGTPTAQATTQLKSAFAELGKSGTKAAIALEAAYENTEYAGMSFTEMMEAGVPLNDVLNTMNDYTEANGKSVLDLFSSIEAGQAVLSLTGEGAALFSKNIEEMGDTAGLVDTAFGIMMDTVEGQGNRLQESGKNLGISIYNGMSSKLVDVLALGNDYIAQLQAGFDENGTDGLMTALGDVLGDAITKLSESLPSVVTLVTNLLTNLATALSTEDNTTAIAEGIAGALEAALGLADAIPDLLDAGLKIATKLITAIAEKAPELVPQIITALTNAIVVIASNAPALVTAGFQLAVAIIGGILKSLPTLISGVVEIFANLFTNKLAVDALFAEQFGATQSAYEHFKRSVADADKNFDTTVSDAQAKRQLANDLLADYDAILGKYNGEDLTAADKTKLEEIVDQLLLLYPTLDAAVDSNTGLLNTNTDAIRKNIDAMADQAIADGFQTYFTLMGESAAAASIEYKKAQMAAQDLRDEVVAIDAEIADLEDQKSQMSYDEQFDFAFQEGGLSDLNARKEAALAALEAAKVLMDDYRVALDQANADIEMTKNAMTELGVGYEGTTAAAQAATDAVSTFGNKADFSTEQIEGNTEAVGDLNDELETAGEALDETVDTADEATSAVMEEAQEILDKTTALLEAQAAIEAAQTAVADLTTKITDDSATSLETITQLLDTIALQHAALLEAIGLNFTEYQDTLALTGKDTAEILLNAMTEILTAEAGQDIANVFLAGTKDAVVAYEPSVKKAFTDVASHSHAALLSWNNAFYNVGTNWADNFASGIRRGQGSVAAAVQSLVASAISAASRISSSYSGTMLPKYRTGLERVPVDDYPALLHKDEAVLTAAEARIWRSTVLGGSRSAQTINIRDQVTAANNVSNGTVHVVLKIGEDVIAEIIEPIVSEKQADRTSTIRG